MAHIVVGIIALFLVWWMVRVYVLWPACGSGFRSRAKTKSSVHVCTQLQTHAYRSGFNWASMSARAVAVSRPAPTHHRSTRVPLHLVWPRTVAYQD